MAKPALARRSGDRRSQGFVYKRRDPGALKARAEQTGGRYDSPFKQGFDTFRPKVGNNLFRILPPTWDNHEHYGYDLYMHRYVGQDQSSYLCLQKMLGKHCPICDAANEAKAAGELDEAKALGFAKVVCPWIIDRDDEQKEHPILYPMGWTMDRDIAALCWNARTGKSLMIDHPTEGFDVSLQRSGQGLMTRYFGIQIDRDPSNIDDDEAAQERILDYISQNPVPDTLHYYDAEYLEKVLAGSSSEKDKDLDEEEVEDERPAARRPARRAAEDEEDEAPRRRPAAREEEDDEPAPRRGRAARDEEDDEPAPRRGRARDEEEDEPPFEEDEAPPRRGRAARDEQDEEDERPARRRPAARDEEEDEPPRRASRRDAEEEDEPPRRRPASRDEEEDEPPRRGPPRRAAREEDDEESAPPRRSGPPRKVVEEEVVEEGDEDEPPARPTRRPTARR